MPGNLQKKLNMRKSSSFTVAQIAHKHGTGFLIGLAQDNQRCDTISHDGRSHFVKFGRGEGWETFPRRGQMSDSGGWK